MRVQGHNILAILAGAIAIWLIGFLIYAVLFEQQWSQWMGLTEADMEKDNGRMPFMVVMPFLQAIGLSLVIKWRQTVGVIGGLMTGIFMAICFAIAARMYGWVYSFEVNELFFLDSAHMLVAYAAAGAIIGAWK